MQYTIAELRRLVETFITGTGMVPSTLGIKICNNSKLIDRLLDGESCGIATGERVSDYLDHNWPEALVWPEEVPRRPIDGRGPSLSAPPGWELVDPGYGQPLFWRQIAVEKPREARPRAGRRGRRGISPPAGPNLAQSQD